MAKAQKQQSEPKLSKQSKMQELASLGQSVWLDSIDHRLIASGELRSLIDQGLRGLTSNPAIFEKAIGETSDYDDRIRELLSRTGHRDLEVKELFDELSIADIQDAADLLAPVYRRSIAMRGATRGEAPGPIDGLVSLELAPFLAHDTEGSAAEARRLWNKTQRPNLMIKVPGTPEGLVAFEKLISEGMNVNVTLLFSQEVYRSFAEAYIRALETRLDQGLAIDSIASVASFFVSRIDSAIDKKVVIPFHWSLKGQIAIANAKCAYQIYLDLFGRQSTRWQRLRAGGARPQRVLWASTSAKNPKYRDVLYIEELIGPDTVTTVPPKTLHAFEEHGIARVTLTEGIDEAREKLRRLRGIGVSLDEITDELTREGIRLFEEPYERLMAKLEKKRRELLRSPLSPMELRLPILMEAETGQQLQRWKNENRVRRLWNGDPAVWTNSDESSWLGWLSIADEQASRLAKFEAFQRDLRQSGFEDVVVLGMGGSSLCADLLSSLFDPADSFPVLHILDSTDPEQIRALESMLDPDRTLFVVSSKSGSTLEPRLFMDYFSDRVSRALGAGKAGSRFVAITDPGTSLEAEAERRGFRQVFHGARCIGGRYSALSDFGLIPAAAMGLNVSSLIGHASEMAHSCSPNVPADENPGLLLGAVLGTLGKAGRDKITLVCSPEIWQFGEWAEQLIAESTGKRGTGLFPVCEEKLGPPSVYGDDRLFVYLKLAGSIDRDSEAKVMALETAGFPVVRIEVSDCPAIAQEFFRWELAVAVAGSILGINPFNQPDVEAAKEETRRLMRDSSEAAAAPGQSKPLAEDGGISLFADENATAHLEGILRNQGAPSHESSHEGSKVRALLRAHLDRLQPGDYFAILAYLPMNLAVNLDIERELDSIRLKVRDERKVATSIGFGPRYLHSTGQLHKGGPNSGVFLMITADVEQDLAIPGKPYGFGAVQAAQAQGDFNVLSAKKRRLLRVHLRDRSLLPRLGALLGGSSGEKT